MVAVNGSISHPPLVASDRGSGPAADVPGFYRIAPPAKPGVSEVPEDEHELRLILPLEALRRIGVLDRQILDILRDDAGGGKMVLAVALGTEVEIGDDIAFIGHLRCFQQ